MAVVQSPAVRRRQGIAPNALVMAESSRPDGLGPVEMLRQQYQSSGSVGVPELRDMLRAVDQVHGRGAGRAAHQQMLENGEVFKGATAKRVAYRPTSEYGG